VLHRGAPLLAECKFGEVIGHLFDSEQDRQDFLGGQGNSASAATGTTRPGPVLTDSARELMERHGVTEERLLALGRAVIRGVDVEQLVAADGAHRLSRNQRAVGEAVSESWQTIPAAFTAARLDAGPAMELRRRTRADRGVDVGLPALLIRAIASSRDDFPLFFGALRDGGQVSVPETAHIGVTIDAGAGLFLPVVRDAADRSAVDISEDLAAFRRAAVHGRFAEGELTGSSLTVSLNQYKDVLVVVPIVFPGQTATVSLSSVVEEFALDAEDRPVRRHTAVLGIAYDHRVVNGRSAAGLLRRIKTELETPARIAALLEGTLVQKRPR
jgi:2-oxoglutarate dehydrogenase E2 component (dihydrolipoamide succinyltransferase)